MNITDAIHAKLIANATLTAALATYGSASPPDPAIFTGQRVPLDAVRPYVWTHGNVADTHFDELADNLGRDILRDVYNYSDNDGSAVEVENIAELIRTTLHRQSLTISDGSHIMTICVGGPTPAPTDDSLLGRVSTYRIVAMEA